MGKGLDAYLTHNGNSISISFPSLPAFDDATRWHVKHMVWGGSKHHCDSTVSAAFPVQVKVWNGWVRKIAVTDQERNKTVPLAGVEKEITEVWFPLGKAEVSGGSKLISLGVSPWASDHDNEMHTKARQEH